MRILMVSPQPYYQDRGAPIAVFTRCRALSDLGCEIDLFTYPMGEDRVPDGTRVRRLLPVPGIRTVPRGPSLRKAFLDLLLFLHVFLELLFSSREYDYLHCHEEAAFFCLPLKRWFGLPLVYDYHSDMGEITRGSERYGARPFVRLTKWIEHTALEGADAVLCQCPPLIDQVREHGPEGRCFVVENTAIEPFRTGDPTAHKAMPSGVDEWLREDEITMVYTGSLEEYQRLDRFLEGFADAPNRDRFQFLVAGGTSDQVERYRTLAGRLGLDDRTRFLGRVNNPRIPRLLEVSDLLLSTRAEGKSTPLKVFGYMWAEKPILATDVEGHRAIFEDDAVIWSPPSSEGFRDALERLDRGTLDRFAQRTRDLFHEQYSYPRFREKHEPFLRTMEAIVEGPGQPVDNPGRQ